MEMLKAMMPHGCCHLVGLSHRFDFNAPSATRALRFRNITISFVQRDTRMKQLSINLIFLMMTRNMTTGSQYFITQNDILKLLLKMFVFYTFFIYNIVIPVVFLI